MTFALSYTEYRFTALDGDLAYLATRHWGSPGPAEVVFFDNVEALAYNPENVAPGKILKLRTVPHPVTEYVVRERPRAVLYIPGRGMARDNHAGESIYDAAANCLGSRYLYDKLAAFNGLAAPFELDPGQILKVPPLAGKGALARAAELARARAGMEGGV